MTRQQRMMLHAICDQAGYGNVMATASLLWKQKCLADDTPLSNFVVGPCEDGTVPCTHPVLDENGHCEVCCGAGWATKWVAEFVASHRGK